MLGKKAMDRREVVFSDIYLDAQGRLQMEFLAPVMGGATASGPPPAVLALEVDPDAFRFPLANSWPTTSKTGETVLVERRGDKVVFLDTTRPRQAAALHLAFPITRTDVPAVKAVRGAAGVVTGVDYSGTDVLAAIGPVWGTPWFLVSKVGLSEVDAPLRSLALVTMVIILGVTLLGGAVILFFWSRWRSRDFQRLYEVERHLRASEQRFKSAFDHAPVGVSLTLPDGKVGHPNATFAEMLGYSVAELEDLTVAEITHPDDRTETARLIEAALAREIDGFKVDRRYLRKDGSDLWATVSVTLPRDELGRPVHFVAMISDISARKVAESALRESEARFRGLFESSLSGFALHEIVLDESGVPVDYVYVEANRAFYELTGLDAATVVGRRASEVFADLPEPPYLEILKDDLRRLVPAVEREVREVLMKRERRAAVAECDLSESRYRALYDQSPAGVLLYDDALRITECNERLAAISGVPRETLRGMDLGALRSPEMVQALRRALVGDNGAFEGPYAPAQAGATLFVALTTAPLRDGEGAVVGGIAVVQDLTERQKFLGTIRKLAYEDGVSGLPNAALFRDRLRQAVTLAKRERRGLAVAIVDLDRFKQINDTLGRSGGDRLLRSVGRRLSKALDDGDTVARVAADEFAVLLPAVAGYDDVAAVAESVLGALRRRYRIAGHDLYVNASVGLALYSSDAADAEALMRFATEAMQAQKRHGGNSWRLYDESMSQRAVERLRLESRLHVALERHEFVVHYQPLVGGDEGVSSVWRRSCAGRTRRTVSSCPATSYRSPRRRGSSSRWARKCSPRPAARWRPGSPRGSRRAAWRSTFRRGSSVNRTWSRPCRSRWWRVACRHACWSSRSPNPRPWTTWRLRATSSAACASWARTARWTTSTPATRRSATSARCPSTCSRSTAPSWPASAGGALRRQSCAR